MPATDSTHALPALHPPACEGQPGRPCQLRDTVRRIRQDLDESDHDRSAERREVWGAVDEIKGACSDMRAVISGISGQLKIALAVSGAVGIALLGTIIARALG